MFFRYHILTYIRLLDKVIILISKMYGTTYLDHNSFPQNYCLAMQLCYFSHEKCKPLNQRNLLLFGNIKTNQCLERTKFIDCNIYKNYCTFLHIYLITQSVSHISKTDHCYGTTNSITELVVRQM